MKFNSLIPELTVSDIDRTKDFYVNILQFKVEYERVEDRFVFLSYPDHRRVLFVCFCLRNTVRKAQWLALVYVSSRFPDHDSVCRYRRRNRLERVVTAGIG